MLRGQLQLRKHPSHVFTETERIDIHAQIFTVSKGLCLLHVLCKYRPLWMNYSSSLWCDCVPGSMNGLCMCKRERERERLSKCPQRHSQSCLLFLNQSQPCGFPLAGGQTEVGSQSTEGPAVLVCFVYRIRLCAAALLKSSPQSCIKTMHPTAVKENNVPGIFNKMVY